MYSLEKRCRKSISLEMKIEVLRRFDAGERNSNICSALGLSDSTVRTIRNNRERILETAKRSNDFTCTRVTRARSGYLESMEELLTAWIECQNRNNCPVSVAAIKRKARSLYENLTNNERNAPTFIASYGWFKRFKKRQGYDCDINDCSVGADQFNHYLKNKIEEGGYVAQQVFHVGEVTLRWKPAESGSGGAHKPDYYCTLLLGWNATGDYKLKPLMVCHFQSFEILNYIDMKDSPVVWAFNYKSMITQKIFNEYLQSQLQAELKEYCRTQNLPEKILLLLGSATGYSHSALLDMNLTIKKILMSEAPSSKLLEPVNQGIGERFGVNYFRHLFADCLNYQQGNYWENFKINNAIEIIGKSWNEIGGNMLNNAWRKIWPEIVTIVENDNGFEIEKDAVIDLARSTGFENAVNIEDLFMNIKTEQLTSEELIDEEDYQYIKEESEEKTLPINQLEVLIEHLNAIEGILETDPDYERRSRTIQDMEQIFDCYRQLYDKQMVTNEILQNKSLCDSVPSSSF